MAREVLIICRHGKPALSKKVRLNWLGYKDWWAKYDEGGLDKKQKIPKRVVKLARDADIVLSSTLIRAVESATLAAGRAPDEQWPELVEAALPPPNFGWYMTGPRQWGTIARISWWLGFSGGQETRREAEKRAELTAEKLTEVASDGKLVFVAAHGWYNRMLKQPLRRRGWTLVASFGDRHWCHRRYERLSDKLESKPKKNS